MYMGQYLVSKRSVIVHFPFFRAHPNVAFVNTQRSFFHNWALVFELVLRIWVPEDSIEKLAVLVLDEVACPCWVFINLRDSKIVD